MLSFKDKFVALVETIVNTDLNEIQQGQFQLEGKEFINEIFRREEVNVKDPEYKSTLEYGFANTAFEISKLSIDFSSLILSIFSLYLQIKKGKNDRFKQKIERIDLEMGLRDRLKSEHMSEELIEVITTKYKDRIEDLIFDELNRDK